MFIQHLSGKATVILLIINKLNKLLQRIRRWLGSKKCNRAAAVAEMAAGIMEANEILLTIDPYWHMFNFVLEHQPRRETNLTIQRTPQLPWIVTKSYSQPGTRAFYHFPHINMWTLPDPYWRLASYKFMHCDYSIILFLMYLERALARYGATVKWLTVKTRPYVLFHRQYERPDADVRHSVFEITARSGNQYIADFTIEQFGYPGYMWFMNKTVYMFQCTLGPWPAQPRQCEVARYRRGDFGRRERYRDWVFREICGMHHFAWWGYEKRERREAWLCSIVFRVWASDVFYSDICCNEAGFGWWYADEFV
ncbi:hypothetical protein P3342_010817 [Pyrenophora teres f. teres]|nr:hypothetical protein P3342_010817 [Pyrenophora teres f. teres]